MHLLAAASDFGSAFMGRLQCIASPFNESARLTGAKDLVNILMGTNSVDQPIQKRRFHLFVSKMTSRSGIIFPTS